MTIQEIADNITNVCYVYPNIVFDYCGETIKIENPTNVLIFNPKEAPIWLAKHYGVLLALLKE